MVFIINLVLCLIALFLIIYLWTTYRYGYWKKRGIFSPPAKFPFGHLGQMTSLRLSFGAQMAKLYHETKQHPCVGLFLFQKKTLLVNDLDLAKRVLLKDYTYFQGHGFKADKEADPLSQHLFNLEGEEWKKIRVKLTPTFTSSKMKYMFDTLLATADDMLEYIRKEVDSGNESIGIKEVFGKFSTDVIGSCAFGIQMNSFKHPDAEFRKMGRKSISTSFKKSVIDIISIIAPRLIVDLKIPINYPDVIKFFSAIVPETIKYREDRNITRNDFLQLLIDMKNKDAKTGESLTMPEITAEVFVFFIAGFETSSTTSSYALLELAENPEIQDRARAEIERELANNDGKISYDALAKMTYLTNIVDETLRIYPVIPFLTRNCSQDYTIPGTNSVIEKGTFVVISPLGIQRDPEFYPDPLKFDPERFLPENVAKRHQFAHIPFGEGPRVCIGSRFGMMQVKLSLLTIILNFDVSLCSKTQLPLQYEPMTFFLHSQGEIYIKLTKRF